MLAALGAAAAWPPILAGYLHGRGAFDQLRFHEPAIFTFAGDWPRPDLSDYLSATTPGYHLVMAYIAITPGADRALVQLAGSVFYLGLLALLGSAVAKRLGPMLGVAMTLPLAASLYVYSAGVWLLPDNAGWLLVLTTILLACSAAPNWRTIACAGLTMVLLVMMRQIHLWAAATLWASAWLGATAPTTRGGLAGEVSRLFGAPRRSFRAMLPALIATAPAFALVGGFAALWGGLTPPTFQVHYHGGNPAAPAFVLALLGIFSVPFAPLLLSVFADAWAASRVRTLGWIVIAGGAGLLLSAAFPTTYDQDAGRWTGLWNIVRALPEWAAPADRSILMVALGTFGGICLIGWCTLLPFRVRWIVLTALAGFIAAQAASRELWQRYNEPFVLILLPVLAAIGIAAADPRSRVARLSPTLLAVPMIMLGATFATITARELATAPRVETEPAPLLSDQTREVIESRQNVDDSPAPTTDEPADEEADAESP